MTTNTITAQDGKATTIKRTFSRETSVSIEIKSDTAIIWTLLTNVSDFPRWNSTIISIEGEIKEGEKIRLKVKLDPKRTFKIKVKKMNPEISMLWGDGNGSRAFTLSKNPSGYITFKMHEKMGGLMFPFYADQIPSFDETFERFAADLKKEAELIYNTKN